MRARVLHEVARWVARIAFALGLALFGAACADDDACAMGACDPARDAGHDAADGSQADARMPRVCEPNEARSCYSGPRGTRDQGTCRGGIETCREDGEGFGPCEGEVVPEPVDDCDDELDGDCNGIVNDGFPDGEDCACTPGAEADCYSGPEGSEDVGRCHGGTHTCDADGRGFGACEGEALPLAARCSSGDDDCNGLPDGDQDLDGDGFTLCEGDCCDSPLDCDTPEAFMPLAYDFAGNALDEDCSGEADESDAPCDAALESDSGELLDFARALELCTRTSEVPASDEPQHGLVSITESLADGSGSPLPAQRALRTDFGAIEPRAGTRMVVLSTGHAADATDVRPAYDGGSTRLMTESDPPTAWLEENFEAFPTLPGCENGDSTRVMDPIMLTLRLRAPANAQAFALDAYFLTSEYPEWVCTDYFDLFVALLDSSYGGQPRNPDDRNLASYVAQDGQRYAVSVNLAQADSGLLRACENGAVGCYGENESTTMACIAPEELLGTGMEVVAGGCGDNDLAGAGTGWFRLAGNVRPGETFELHLALWDAGDALYDSLVLLDAFRWLPVRVEPGISP